ncbi:hypothetical protein PR202_gb18260 [Eleusine coracana subsp. coracana]|uniref:CAAX prenyl protease 2/Lysostaphin resistance protein A-like domain-containing protein n=1 Tax=Eleusine coracana subsp. coracana TaxID=191504 RepID=A0AAV5F546_ELECO|nr:hypothetical protein PR202_gb18260 [Eleusine coracana subsp. coracana]
MEVRAHSCSFATTYTHCSIGFTPRLRTCRSSWIRAAAESGGDPRRSLAADGPRVVEVAVGTTTTTGGAAFGAARDAELAMWDKLGAVVRLSYGIGIYAAMALAGRFICQMAGIDCTGGFHPSLTALVQGLGYAAPPIMALLFILDDEVVKYSPHARAIRDVEDEELRSFFYGMSPWQFILIVTASSVGEELFYRAAVQGALADIFLRGTELMKDARGIASLSGMVPPFVPFAQTFAAAITAALTAWYERRQMRKIYSPLLEGILALYLGLEWIQTDNIMAPMITHGIYSAVVLGHGLWKIHDHRRRLRQRIQQVRRQGSSSSESDTSY